MYIQITVAYFGKSGTLEQIKWDSVPLYLISFCDAVIILFSKARPKFFTSWPKCRLQAYVILKKHKQALTLNVFTVKVLKSCY